MEYIELIKSISQIIFYVVTMIVAIFTYINARKSILSPVNTEYQKRIFDRLSEITNFICSEFQFGKSEYHLYQLPMEETLKEIVGEYELVKSSIADKGSFDITDFPASKEWIKFSKKYDEVQFDPYIPEKLKEPILKYLSKRADAANIAHCQAVKNFIDYANEHGCSNVINIDNDEIHNYYLVAMEQQNCDVDSLEIEVDKIKENFQKYMESFQP